MKKPASRAGFRRLALRGALGLLVVSVVLAGVFGIYFRGRLRDSLPRLDGEHSLAGLAVEAVVERDRLGVARIRAESEADAIRVLGFLHGQERFFQMDLMRRQAAGELSELLGGITVDADRAARRHRMRARAERAVAAMPETRKRRFAAYRDGVNAGVAALDAPPFEYLALGSEPAPWRTTDSLLAVVAMYFVLNDSEGLREARTAALHAALPEELVRFLHPPGTEWDAPLAGGPFPTPEVPGPGAFAGLAGSGTTSATGEPPPEPGSNSWVAAAFRTAAGTGGGMVASDMHLELNVPNRWYRAELHYAGRRLAGLTLPGVPSLIAGTNGRVAWGFTNSSGDWTDLVEIEPDPEDPARYRTPDGFRAMEAHEEVIAVAGGDPVIHEVWETIWGPVTEVAGRRFAIRWIAHDPEGLRAGYLDLAGSERVAEVFAAARSSGMPPQNIVAADVEGTIGWSIAGPIPRRRGFVGDLPGSWADGSRGWDGYLRPEEVPEILDPPSGLLWTANNRIVDGAALEKIGIGGAYAHGGRATLIRDRLLGAEALDEAAMLDIQLEDRARELEPWRRRFIEAVEVAGGGDAEAAEIAAVLRDSWTGRASPDSVGYRLVRNARLELFEATYGALTEPARQQFPDFSPFVAVQWPGPLARLADVAPAHFVPPGATSWPEALADAARRAARAMSDGGPLAAATWGEQNRVRVRHPLSAAFPGFLARFLDAPPRALPGDSGLPRAQTPGAGPSNRFVIAPGREADAILHMPGGQAGHPLAPYYLAGHEDWEEGRPTPLLAGETVWRLTLAPPPPDREGQPR